MNPIADDPPHHRDSTPNPHYASERVEPACSNLVEEWERARCHTRAQQTPHQIHGRTRGGREAWMEVHDQGGTDLADGGGPEAEDELQTVHECDGVLVLKEPAVDNL